MRILILMAVIWLSDLPAAAGPPVVKPTEKGPYSKCKYTSKQHLHSPQYLSAAVYYPCDTQKGPFAATTITGGWTNKYMDMDWISNHIVTHGYVVIAITPSDNMGKNPEWRRAHNAGVAKLKSENQRRGGPIFGMVKTDAIQLMGYSKGGGGALMAGSDQRKEVKSILALAPYADDKYDFSGIEGAALLLTSSADRLAPASKVHTMFRALPVGGERTLVSFNNFRHLEWFPIGLTELHDKALTLIVAWMKVHLDGDLRYSGYIDGHQSDWFEEFIHLPAGKSLRLH